MRLNVDGLFIMIAGVTTEDDALLSIGLGASAVSFDFALSPRQISPAEAHDIVRRLPPGALSVGRFRQELSTRVTEIANTIGLSAVQLEGPVSLEDVAYVAERVNTVLRVLPEGDEQLSPLEGVDYLVAPEEDELGALERALGLLADSGPAAPLIASGGLDAGNVAEVVANYPVYGVEARAGVESSPGVKDPVRLGEFIARARYGHEHARVERHFDEWFL